MEQTHTNLKRTFFLFVCFLLLLLLFFVYKRMWRKLSGSTPFQATNRVIPLTNDQTNKKFFCLFFVAWKRDLPRQSDVVSYCDVSMAGVRCESPCVSAMWAWRVSDVSLPVPQRCGHGGCPMWVFLCLSDVGMAGVRCESPCASAMWAWLVSDVSLPVPWLVSDMKEMVRATGDR